MTNSRGISSILIVGLVLALTAGAFGLWYFNKMQVKVVDPDMNVMVAEPTVTPTPAVTPQEDLKVESLSTQNSSVDADLDKLESQMQSVEDSFDDSSLDDLN